VGLQQPAPRLQGDGLAVARPGAVAGDADVEHVVPGLAEALAHRGAGGQGDVVFRRAPAAQDGRPHGPAVPVGPVVPPSPPRSGSNFPTVTVTREPRFALPLEGLWEMTTPSWPWVSTGTVRTTTVSPAPE